MESCGEYELEVTENEFEKFKEENFLSKSFEIEIPPETWVDSENQRLEYEKFEAEKLNFLSKSSEIEIGPETEIETEEQRLKREIRTNNHVLRGNSIHVSVLGAEHMWFLQLQQKKDNDFKVMSKQFWNFIVGR